MAAVPAPARARHYSFTLSTLVFIALFGCSTATIRRHYLKWSLPCTRNYECERPDYVSCIPIRANISSADCATPDGEKHRCECRLRSKLGHNCNDLADCKTGRCIRGRCVVPGKLGSPCALYFDDRDCEGDSTCINERCRPRSPLDGPCEAFWNCQQGYSCIRDKCKPKSKPGQECESSIDCENSICKKEVGKSFGKCDADIGSIMGSVVAFTVVIATTGTLQYCAWKPRRLA